MGAKRAVWEVKVRHRILVDSECDGVARFMRG
jgi:hypothetical protein